MPNIRSAIRMSVFFYAVYAAASGLDFLLSYGGPGFDRSLVFLLKQTTAWTATLLVVRRNAGADWRECFPLTRVGPRLVLPLVLASMGALIVLAEIAALIPTPESMEEYARRFWGNSLLAGISIVIVAPVAEEMFFRGWMLRGFLGHYSRWKSVLVTAALFAVFHLNPWQSVVAFPLGVASAWLVLKTGSLVPSILCHAVVNSTGHVLELILGKLGYDADALDEMTHLPLPVLACGIVLLMLAGYRVYREATRLARGTASAAGPGVSWRGAEALPLEAMSIDNETNEQRIERVIREEIAIVPYDRAWPGLFRQEKEHLLSCLPHELVRRIEHFGSTAVPGLAAKPIVDMLVEVTDLEATKARIAPVLESQGYEYFWRPTHGDDGPPFYAWFIKRDPHTRARTHHIHMVEAGFNEHWDRLLFRDYLIEHPEVAREYEALKYRLASAAADRIAYTRGKTEFIVGMTERAKRHYRRDPA